METMIPMLLFNISSHSRLDGQTDLELTRVVIQLLVDHF